MSIITGQSAAPAPDGSSSKESSSVPASGSQPQASWRDSLPEDIRGNAALASYKDVASLAKSHIHAQSMIGADKIILPGKDATPEQRAEFYKKLGRPDAATDYGIKLPQGYDESKLDKTRLDTWRGKLHELGLSKTQGEALIESFINEEHTALQTFDKQRVDRLAADERAVKTLFGEKYDENINYVRLALREFGNDELYAAIDQAGLGNNPHLVAAFAKIGRSLTGDGRPTGGGAGGGGDPMASPEHAQAEIARLGTDKAFMAAVFDRSNPGHAAAIARRAALFKAAFPNQPVA